MVDITGQRFGRLIALRPTKERSGSAIKWECKCDCGRTKNISVNALRQKATISCGCINSKGELKVSQILDKLNIKYELQKRFSSCRNPKTDYQLPFDFYLPEYNSVIEYNGEQHYISRKKGFFTEDIVKEIQERDLIKKNFCDKNHINYIEISYVDYDILDDNYILEILNNL